MKIGIHIFKTVFTFLLVAFLMLEGCKSTEKVPPEVRQSEKQQEAEQKQALLEYQRAVKHHHDIQTGQTKKNMKTLKKEQKKLNKMHKRSLWNRIFHPGCKAGK